MSDDPVYDPEPTAAPDEEGETDMNLIVGLDCPRDGTPWSGLAHCPHCGRVNDTPTAPR